MTWKIRSASLAATALFLMAAAGNASAAEARTTFGIEGMTCGGCVASVKLQLGRTEGVTGHEKCRQGLDRCEAANPQGACCLGNVREVVSAAASAPLPAPAEAHPDDECYVL
jgi:hypothetical protein